jgi:hypothetical protein
MPPEVVGLISELVIDTAARPDPGPAADDRNISSSSATLSSSCFTLLTGLPVSYTHSRLSFVQWWHEGLVAEHRIRRLRQYRQASPRFNGALYDGSDSGRAVEGAGPESSFGMARIGGQGAPARGAGSDGQTNGWKRCGAVAYSAFSGDDWEESCLPERVDSRTEETVEREHR